MLITNTYKSATYILVSHLPNNANSNINPLLLFILDTTTLVKNNTIRLLLCQSFTITSCESNSAKESSKVCNIALEYNIIEVEVEASKSLIYIAIALSIY